MQKLTLASCNFDSSSASYVFACDIHVVTAGDGYCEAGRAVHVTEISITHYAFDGEVSTLVSVTHDSTADVYMDSALASAASEALCNRVQYTEEGMQEDGTASMEYY